MICIESSPRPWGCFRGYLPTVKIGRVFPTPVGVFPTRSVQWRCVEGLPHARGGVSKVELGKPFLTWSSPRPWGCFLLPRGYACAQAVFPTPVGVFLVVLRGFSHQHRLPHARGGVSIGYLYPKGKTAFSLCL